ncbi:MAG: hypothetical protein M1829_004929 [Trizodia sp. TS-e1964]|nr:MAG: hypothetical protein M1829_004929 [Trizodia sp. TS-e1964]
MISPTLLISAFCLLNASFCLASPTPQQARDFNHHEEAVVRPSMQPEEDPLRPLVPAPPKVQERSDSSGGATLRYVLSRATGYYGVSVDTPPLAHMLIIECELLYPGGKREVVQCPKTLGAPNNILSQVFYTSYDFGRGVYFVVSTSIERAYMSGIKNPKDLKNVAQLTARKYITSKEIQGVLPNQRAAKNLILATPLTAAPAPLRPEFDVKTATPRYMMTTEQKAELEVAMKAELAQAAIPLPEISAKWVTDVIASLKAEDEITEY